MPIQDDELLRDFVIESLEHLASVESQLLELEGQDESVDLGKVNNVFRAIHSIKGVARFLNLDNLESLAHREEEVLNRLRNNELRPTTEVVNTLLKATDRIRSMIETIESSAEVDISMHIAALEHLLEGSLHASEESEPVEGGQGSIGSDAMEDTVSLSPMPHQASELVSEYARILLHLESHPKDAKSLQELDSTLEKIDRFGSQVGYSRLASHAHEVRGVLQDLISGGGAYDVVLSVCMSQSLQYLRKQVMAIEQGGRESGDDDRDIIDSFRSTLAMQQQKKMASTKQLEPVRSNPTKITTTEGKKESPLPAGEAQSIAASESTIRVDVALLDKLMTRVGELVLARNQILQYAGRIADSDLQGATQRLNLITTELQEGVMKTRMQPIGNIWGKLPRLVRDLAEQCGKRVRIEMQGKETELDKTIIEAIKDPLTHLVRNTVDHGIEKPDVRRSKSKSEEGCLSLRAFHEGGQVNIEISDDGSGLNLSKIRAKAAERGLLSHEQVNRLADHEAAQLIFLPGFSTAEQITNVSGRGVGMDVVRTNIEKIGGAIDLQTKEGVGTTIKIKIPLTLAIIPALIITDNSSRFAIPQVNLSELVRVEGTNEHAKIEWIQGTPVYRLRGELLPLVYLHQILGKEASKATDSESTNIVVLRVDGRQFGLVVDRISDTEEIVVKPMGQQLKHISVFAGATIMGDGKVALILDVPGIAFKSKVLSNERERSSYDASTNSAAVGAGQSKRLVLCSSYGRRLALPTCQVARLEKIMVDSIEITDNREVVQYRNSIMPLIRVGQALGIPPKERPHDSMIEVIIYEEAERTYGLVVDQIVDIVESTFDNTYPCQSSGLQASTIIDGHVTDLVNLPSLIQEACKPSRNHEYLFAQGGSR